MKDRWKNNLGLKIAAVLFSVFLWWTVVNVDDPIDTGTYKTDVQLLNTNIITDSGQSFKILNAQTITVTVKARRKILDEIKTSHIQVTADFREYNETTKLVPVRVKINGYESSYEEVSTNPRNLQLETEAIVTKTFPIYAEKTGQVREGYVVAGLTPEPQSISISGPGSVVNRISKVAAKVSVSELSKNTSLQAELIYYDSADNVLDQTTLTSNCDQNGVVVHVEVWRTKSLELKFDTNGIVPAEGYLYGGIKVEPQTIRVAGVDDIIIPMTQIDVAKEALMKEGLTANEEVVVNMADFLPEGIILADEAASSVVVTITVEKAGTKSLMLPVRSVKIENASEEFEVIYGEKQEVELQFEGPNEELAELTSSVIVASVDLSKYTEEDTYEIPVQVKGLPNQCEYLGGATIQITLKKK